jgi:hypothetical protein
VIVHDEAERRLAEPDAEAVEKVGAVLDAQEKARQS